MQQWVMLLPALHTIHTDKAVRERLATPHGGAVVPSVSSMPVETQGTSFGILDHRHLVLDAKVLESGAIIESAPEERIVVGAELVLEIASWTGRLGWLRVE